MSFKGAAHEQVSDGRHVVGRRLSLTVGRPSFFWGENRSEKSETGAKRVSVDGWLGRRCDMAAVKRGWRVLTRIFIDKIWQREEGVYSPNGAATRRDPFSDRVRPTSPFLPPFTQLGNARNVATSFLVLNLLNFHFLC